MNAEGFQNRFSMYLFVLVITFLATGTLSAKSENIFKEIDIKPGGKVLLCFLEDIDNDGAQETAVLWKKGKYPEIDIYLSVYRMKKTKTLDWKSERLYTQILSRNNVFIDAGSRKGSALKSFFVLRYDGVTRIDWDGKSVSERKIIDKETLVGLGEIGDVSYWNFVSDFNGDGLSEIMIPTKHGMELWAQNSEGAYEKTSFFDVPPRYYYRSSYGAMAFEIKRSFRGSYWVHKIFSLDFNADGFRDVLFLWMDEIDVFLGDSTGRFSKDKKLHFFFKDLNDEERFDGSTYVIYSFEDIDGNGLPDIIKNRFKGSFTSMKSQMEITFRKDPNSIEGDVHVQEPRSGVGQGGLLEDINKDDKKDLVIVSSSFGIFAIIKALIKKKIDMRFEFYKYRDKVRFGKKYDFRRTLTFGFDLKRTEIEGILPDLEVDFNGDGKRDVLFATETEELKTIVNEGDKPFRLSKVQEFKVKTSKKYAVGDLNSDGKTDVVFYYKKRDLAGIVKVLLNNFKN